MSKKEERKKELKEENKEKTAKLHNSGLKIKEIAENIGVSVGTVNRYIKELKEEGKIQVIDKEKVEKRILELYNQGIEIKEIAKSLNMSIASINKYTKKLRQKGMIQNRKLIKSIKIEKTQEKILELYNQGINVEKIATKLNLSSSTVYRTIRKLNKEGRIQSINKKGRKKKTLELYNLGLETKEISKRLNVTVESINTYIKELREEGKIQQRERKNVAKEENKKKILELYNQGLYIKEIANEVYLAETTVNRYIKELKEEGKIQQGKRKNVAKEKNKEKILELYNLGMKRKEIAEKLNISVGTIQKYKIELVQEGKLQIIDKKKERKEKVIELYNQGIDSKEIAKRLEVSVVTINTYISELIEAGKIQQRKRKRKSIAKEENKKKILKLYNQGLDVKEIADELYLVKPTVYKYIKELKEERRIRKRRSIKREKNKINIIEEESRDIQKIVNKEKYTKKDYQKFSEYISRCKERLNKRQLKKEELTTIKKVVDITYKYSDIIFYIKSCIHLGQTLEARRALNEARLSSEILPEQREKLNELSRKIIEVEKKRTAIIMLKRGKGVAEAVKSSGLSETEVIKLNRKLLAKSKKTSSIKTLE